VLFEIELPLEPLVDRLCGGGLPGMAGLRPESAYMMRNSGTVCDESA